MQTSTINTIKQTSGSQETLKLLHDARAQKVAQEFESIFTSMMLKSMRGASAAFESENDLFPSSLGEKVYTDMLDDEYGKLMSDHGSFGLADLILKQIQKNEGSSSSSSLSMLSGLASPSWMIDKSFVPSGTIAPAQNTMNRVTMWSSYITEAGIANDVDPRLISAIIAQESGGNPAAVSPKGAKGLMQLIDSTARDMGVTQVFNPRDNIMGGAKYLRQMLDRYNGDETRALAAYNAGPGAVDQYNGIPPYTETQRYVGSVLNLRDQIPLSTFITDKEVTDGTEY
jgi:Rod binding domain-containing protein